jgi:membrane peptidoglycan carboxypeptidase
VQVTGTLAFVATARWPEGTWRAKPAVRDFSVAGLGTEKLLDAQLPPACRTGASDGTPLAGWVPRALVAAEDARFFEHPGYDLDHLLAAAEHNQRDGAPLRGGSTLTQQLAKLTITGDDRSAARKLRELLYAVEMERTLGKARVLQLYLALAPWGEGVCGAERAAQVYLGKSASKIGPVSAAWLVSLLRNPDAQLQRAVRARELDRERIKQIVAGMRPMSTAQRTLANEQLGEWMPW